MKLHDKWTVGSETFVAATFEGTATSLATTVLLQVLTADSSPADDDLRYRLRLQVQECLQESS